MTQVVPLQATPSQTTNGLLGDQQAQLRVYQTMGGLFIDVSVDNVLVIGGVVCEDLNRIVRSAYLGFSGDLAFYDTTGAGADPYYSGLGDRFQLLYFTEAELAAAGL